MAAQRWECRLADVQEDDEDLLLEELAWDRLLGRRLLSGDPDVWALLLKR